MSIERFGAVLLVVGLSAFAVNAMQFLYHYVIRSYFPTPV